MSLESHAVVVLGGGIAGLSAAYRLEQEGCDYHLFEAEERIGGLCRSESVDGFTFDYTGHLLHFSDARTERFVKEVLDMPLIEHKRRAWIFSDGSYTRYPFQRNLYGLPLEVVKECVLDYVEAELAGPTKGERDFKSWLVSSFGEGISDYFMIPYNRKLWLVEPEKLTCDWMGRLVPDTNPVEIIKGAFSSDTEEVGYNACFFYPREGGIETLPRSLAAGLKNISCAKKAEAIDLKKRLVYFQDGSSCSYGNLIATVPLPELVSSSRPTSLSVKEAASRLTHTSVLDVNLGFKVGDLTDKHWVYVAEPEIPFYRIGFPHNFSSSLVPEGKSSVYAEISYRGDHAWREESLVREVISGMRTMGLQVKESDLDVVKIIDMKHAYVIYDSNRSDSLAAIRGFLEINGISNVGRFGSWSYLSIEDAINQGLEAAETFIS